MWVAGGMLVAAGAWWWVHMVRPKVGEVGIWIVAGGAWWIISGEGMVGAKVDDEDGGCG